MGPLPFVGLNPLVTTKLYLSIEPICPWINWSSPTFIYQLKLKCPLKRAHSVRGQIMNRQPTVAFGWNNF